MSVSHSNDYWFDLTKKTTSRSFLGNITTRWSVLRYGEDYVKISLYRAKFLSSLVCSILLFIFLLLIMACSKKWHSEYFIVFFLPVIWLFVGSFWGCKRSFLWAKGDDEIKLVRGIFPKYETFFLDINKLSARLEWSNQSKTSITLYLYNSEHADSRVKLIDSVRRPWIMPIFDQLKQVIGDSCVDATC